MRICSIQVGKPVTIHSTGSGEWWDKEWTTAFFKRQVRDPQWMSYRGFSEDGQADTAVHGGTDKAVCVYSHEHYGSWKTVIGQDPLEPGAFGENLTVEGMTEERVRVGDIYQIGEAVVQVSQPREPCWKVSRRWKVKDLTAKIAITGFTGFYFRVLWHGYVSDASNITRLERGNEEWTIAQCNQIMHHEKDNLEMAQKLSEYPPLSGAWKDQLYARVSSQLNR
jgi:MOSC domain-containing protein YiiM